MVYHKSLLQLVPVIYGLILDMIFNSMVGYLNPQNFMGETKFILFVNIMSKNFGPFLLSKK